MNRQQKDAVVTDVRACMQSSEATFLVSYQGMTVASLQALRKGLRKDGGTFKVAKATLMRRASEDIEGSEAFSDLFKNQVGLVFADKEVSGIAKQLSTFAKENAALKLIAGFYQSRMLSAQDMAMLASLPSREVLLAQLCGTLQAPTATLTRMLHLLIARLVYVLKRIEEKQAQNQ